MGYTTFLKESKLFTIRTGGSFQTTANEVGDNYIDLMVGGMISHEKTTLTTWTRWTRCRMRLPSNAKKAILW